MESTLERVPVNEFSDNPNVDARLLATLRAAGVNPFSGESVAEFKEKMRVEAGRAAKIYEIIANIFSKLVLLSFAAFCLFGLLLSGFNIFAKTQHLWMAYICFGGFVGFVIFMALTMLFDKVSRLSARNWEVMGYADFLCPPSVTQIVEKIADVYPQVEFGIDQIRVGGKPIRFLIVEYRYEYRDELEDEIYDGAAYLYIAGWDDKNNEL